MLNNRKVLLSFFFAGTMADKIPKNFSNRTRKIMSLVAPDSDDSDEDVDSDDSYVPEEEEDYETSDHDTASEFSDGEIAGECLENEDNEILPDAPAQSAIEGQQTIPEVHVDLSMPDNNLNSNVQSQMVIPEIPEEELMSDDDLNADNLNEETPKYFGKKNCFTWNSIPQCAPTSRSGRNTIHARISKLMGPALAFGDTPSIEEIWRLFFTNEMIEMIILHTNRKLAAMREKLKNQKDLSYKDTNTSEMNALLGVIVLCCIFKSNREALASLFSTASSGRSIFRAIMPLKRCEVLLRALRFDDPETRPERVKENKAAAILEFYELFNNNCKQNYSIGAYACVDETLVPFRGRCGFLIYMPKKPAKYGIKLMCMTDAENGYLLNSYIYCGKGSDGHTLSPAELEYSKPTQAVVRLTKVIANTNRNVTCDNWFTSIELANILWEKHLTLVGTVKANKPQIPPVFLKNTKKQVGSKIYGYTQKLTLLSYVPRKNRAVLVLSSMHHKPNDDQATGKPEMIELYNLTKGGVDQLDMKCSNYCANRKTRRWPLAIFYHLVAASCSNAFVLYKHYKTKKMRRFQFMHELGMSLIGTRLGERLQIPNLPHELRELIKNVLLEVPVPENRTRLAVAGRSCSSARLDDTNPTRLTEKSDHLSKQTSCRYCPYKLKRKTSTKCIKCDTASCRKCYKALCNECVQKLE